MHENRHFRSYRKRRHDAENHVHICALRRSGESLQMAISHRVTDLETVPVRVSKDEAPTQLSVVGPLIPPCYFIFLSRTLIVRCVAFQPCSFSLAFTTG